MNIQPDSKGQPFVAWEQPVGGFKRAWIRAADPGKDWTGTGYYINVARTESLGNGPSSGGSPDFPIYSEGSHEDILKAFVEAVCRVTECPVP